MHNISAPVARTRPSFGIFALSTLAAALAACSGGGEGSGPGGVSEGEAESLDDAAEMLDERQLRDDAIPSTELPAAEQGNATNAVE